MEVLAVRMKATGVAAIGALAMVFALGFSPTKAPSLGDGVNVHGHWAITILNDDGTVAQSHEFENALSEPGQDALVRILGETGRAGLWNMFVGTPQLSEAQDPCGTVFSVWTGCYITAVTVETEFVETGAQARVVLSGQTTATQDGSIGFVMTLLQSVACTAGEADCLPNDYRSFTETEPRQENGTMFEVSEGQVIQIQVEITFS
jgi:hypothetical protein